MRPQRRKPLAVYCNPPYAPRNTLNEFLETAARTRDAGLTVVCLIPASVGTNWWHDLVLAEASDVEVLRGRVVNGGPHSRGIPAPWPSAIVTYAA